MVMKSSVIHCHYDDSTTTEDAFLESTKALFTPVRRFLFIMIPTLYFVPD